MRTLYPDTGSGLPTGRAEGGRGEQGRIHYIIMKLHTVKLYLSKVCMYCTVLYKAGVSERMGSFSDLYPERRGGVVNPTVLQRATGTQSLIVD